MFNKKYIIILFMIFFSSCSFLPKKNYVYLYLEPKISKYNFKKDISIKIDVIEVNRPFNKTDIYYSLRPLSLQFYAYHRWAIPIKDMLYSIILNNYGNDKDINFICNSSKTYNNYVYHMKIKIIKFLHQYYGDKSFALVEMKFLLYKNGKLISIKNYNIKERCIDNTPYGAVLAFNKAISYIFSNINSWIFRNIK